MVPLSARLCLGLAPPHFGVGSMPECLVPHVKTLVPDNSRFRFTGNSLVPGSTPSSLSLASTNQLARYIRLSSGASEFRNCATPMSLKVYSRALQMARNVQLPKPRPSWLRIGRRGGTARRLRTTRRTSVTGPTWKEGICLKGRDPVLSLCGRVLVLTIG